jgi:biotin-[acetyl-CoA-carboxylase] ligase BirA-like protein
MHRKEYSVKGISMRSVITVGWSEAGWCIVLFLMQVLTDNRDLFAEFLPQAEWRDGPSDLDRDLWDALAQGRPAWVVNLPEERFWSRLVLVGSAPESQFDILRSLLGGGSSLPGPVAAVALTGEKFHGHRGRRWEVKPGNLHLSAAMEPGRSAADMGPALNMLPAVASVDAIAEATGGLIKPGIKWVNDILHEGRKIGGVLAASHVTGMTLDSAIFGIGINVTERPDVEPTPFVPLAGSLDGAGLSQVMWAVLRGLGRRYRELLAKGPAPLLEAYRRHSLVVGRKVRIWEESTGERSAGNWPEPLAAGRVESIEPDLSLRIEGRNEAVGKGRLAFEQACRDHGL